ncbi:MAG: hypothetical protein Q8S14_05380 [Algoriphagus sp.]|uniref:hypothetical protein n=1 Tax=Algoriphagus sp. TaxID=1872435 RepID=UPI002731630C|nr:hypothetical protein [Algoriphagus sp.]MDP2042226.1 hypothetical protein [Algoriphagus sp.]MDP3471287.1 hypothetical protein [Algoriphagus sp.]
MKTKNIILFGLLAILICADIAFELNKGLFYLIFLSLFLLINFIDWYKINKIRNTKKKSLISVNSNNWITVIASWTVFSSLILKNQESTSLIVGCVFLLILNAAFNMLSDLRDDYLIENGQLIHLRTDKIIESTTIKEIEKSDRNIAIHTYKYKNHLVFEVSKLIDLSLEELIIKLEKIKNEPQQ